MPSYYVWLEYYCPPPVAKNVKSSELKFADKHQHGAKPTQAQLNSLQPSLTMNVTDAYNKYNNAHLAAPQAVPAAVVITQGHSFKTRSEK
jgi:hypothetical protein